MRRKFIEAKDFVRSTKSVVGEVMDIGLNVGVGMVNAAQAEWFIIRGKAKREQIDHLKKTVPVLLEVEKLDVRTRHERVMKAFDAAYHVGDQVHRADFNIAVNEAVFDASQRINRSFREDAFHNWTRAAKRLISW